MTARLCGTRKNRATMSRFLLSEYRLHIPAVYPSAPSTPALDKRPACSSMARWTPRHHDRRRFTDFGCPPRRAHASTESGEITMTKGRLEAFTDGVIAIIIT